MSEVQFGPINSKLIEPIKIQTKIKKGKIIDVNVKADYVHRAIERYVQGRNIFSTIYLVERVCGICSHAHTTPYCQTIERVFNQKPSERASYIRVVVAELERMQSHLLNLFEIIHLDLKNAKPFIKSI